jgi:hypothetical protein
MISIEWKPNKAFHETVRKHLIDRGVIAVRRSIQVGFDEHISFIQDWNHQPNIRGVFSSELYAVRGQLLIEDAVDSWWWLVNDGGSTMPKGGGPLYPIRAKAMKIAMYDAKSDGGSGGRTEIGLAKVVYGPRVVAARDILGKVEEKVTPIIIDLVRRTM